MKSGAVVIAGASAPATAAAQPPPPQPQQPQQEECIPEGPQSSETGVDFDFTGLFAFRLKQRDQIQMLLLDAKKAKLKDAHAPLLMMPHDCYEPANLSTGNEAYRPPNTIKIGSTWMAVWSLVNANVWVRDAHAKFNDPDLEGKVLTYDDSDIGCTPSPICQDKGWASLKWFAMLPDLMKKPQNANDGALRTNSKPLECRDKMVASYVRLTRGHASGRAPATACEQNRKYMLDNIPSTARTYATQMHVVYPSKKGILKLAIAPKGATAGIKVIHVRITDGKLTPISILNTPMTHVDHHHYRAFYELVGKDGRTVSHDDPCTVQFRALVHAAMASGGAGEQPSAPDPDCIPPGMFLP